ncbi:MAG: hypothetical protein FJ291_32375, partial [Planctomycetes bacterium]|nr:hypothetical protein [Planctomycetota bacterium]
MPLCASFAPAAEAKDAWGVKGQVPLRLEALFDNDAIADAQRRSDGNFDCPDHAADIPGSVFPAENLPATGSKFSFDGTHFLFPSKERGDFNNVSCNGQRVEVPPGRYKALHVVGTSENGTFRDTLALAYKEGPAEAELALRDWCQKPEAGDRVAFEAPCRYTYSSEKRTVVREEIQPRIWLRKIALDPKKTLEAIALPYNRRMHVFAATLEAEGWTEEQAAYAKEAAEHYAGLDRRSPVSAENVLRQFAALGDQIDQRIAAGGPLVRQLGWLRTHTAHWQHRLGDLYSFFGAATQAPRALQGLTNDLRALAAGNDPFAGRRGTILRSYRAEVDGSLQSYSLGVPGDYKADKPFPLLVSLHGHGWYAPFQGHPARVNNGLFTVAPHGRGSQDYMLAAEDDVLAVIDDVVRDYWVDLDRIYVEGSSMGGTGSWQLGVHHPGRFAAIAPICGNADRRAWDAWKPKKRRVRYEMPPRFAELRNWLLDTVEPVAYAGNLLNLPALAAHGAIDDVVPAANSRNMADAAQKLGCTVGYQEFPTVRHWGFPNDFFVKRWEWTMAQKRNPAPERVRYKTASLRHDGAYWVRILRFIEPLKFADIDARHIVAQPPSAVAPGRFEITTSSISAFLVRSSAFRRSSDAEPPKGGTTNVKIDGQELTADDFSATFVRGAGGKWSVGQLPVGLAKKKGLEGPVADAFLGSFMLVRGTTSPDPREREVIRREAEAKARDWERLFNCRPRLKDDTAVTDADIAQHHLVLYGGPAANALAAKVAGKLPIAIERDCIRVGPQAVGGASLPRVFRGDDVGVKLCYPNPLNPERYVVLFAGLSPAALDQINNRFGNWFGWGPYDNYDWFDYGVFDARTISPETFLCVGFFDMAWKLDERYQFLGDDTARKAIRPQSVPKLHTLPDPAPAELYLSALMPTLVDQHKGLVGYDRSHQGNPLRIGLVPEESAPGPKAKAVGGASAPRVFSRGLGVRAPSKVEYQLGGQYAFFRATVGIDLEDDLEATPARDRGERVQFIVYGDGKRLYSSEWLKWNSKPVAVEVDIKGVKTLRLEADCSLSR